MPLCQVTSVLVSSGVLDQSDVEQTLQRLVPDQTLSLLNNIVQHCATRSQHQKTVVCNPQTGSWDVQTSIEDLQADVLTLKAGSHNMQTSTQNLHTDEQDLLTNTQDLQESKSQSLLAPQLASMGRVCLLVNFSFMIDFVVMTRCVGVVVAVPVLV